MKNFLVVGHSSGIGKCISEQLSAQHRVYGTFYKNDIPVANANTSSHPLDVMNEPDLSFLPDQLDGIAYCPGSIVLKPFARITEADFIADYRLQVTGAIKIIQHCLPLLKQSGDAGIVLFSSVAAGTGFNFHSMVSSSKGAIEGLVKALAAELAPSIRVNAIALSITDTPLAAGLLGTPEKREASQRRHPLNRIGNAVDIAALAAFLLSSNASFITGQVIKADGGISAVR